MNVSIGGAAKLAGALAGEGALPAWLGADAHRSVPRRPLVAIACVGAALLVALAAGAGSTTALVRATSACFVAVYVIALASAVRVLDGRMRAAAVVALALVVVVAVFSSAYLLVPAGSAVVALWVRRSLRLATG
jgi:amino acid efflux transporter